jgi:hypothetical protein
VTSRNDQEQYWAQSAGHYKYVPISRFVEGFRKFHVGASLQKELFTPYDKSKSHPSALVSDKYSLSGRELLRACFAREFILMKRNLSVWTAKLVQVIEKWFWCLIYLQII